MPSKVGLILKFVGERYLLETRHSSRRLGRYSGRYCRLSPAVDKNWMVSSSKVAAAIPPALTMVRCLVGLRPVFENYLQPSNKAHKGAMFQQSKNIHIELVFIFILFSFFILLFFFPLFFHDVPFSI